jgi:uncharacterized membrane protein
VEQPLQGREPDTTITRRSIITIIISSSITITVITVIIIIIITTTIIVLLLLPPFCRYRRSTCCRTAGWRTPFAGLSAEWPRPSTTR